MARYRKPEEHGTDLIRASIDDPRPEVSAAHGALLHAQWWPRMAHERDFEARAAEALAELDDAIAQLERGELRDAFTAAATALRTKHDAHATWIAGLYAERRRVRFIGPAN